jgi:hypothetical protein
MPAQRPPTTRQRGRRRQGQMHAPFFRAETPACPPCPHALPPRARAPDVRRGPATPRVPSSAPLERRECCAARVRTGRAGAGGGPAEATFIARRPEPWVAPARMESRMLRTMTPGMRNRWLPSTATSRDQRVSPSFHNFHWPVSGTRRVTRAAALAETALGRAPRSPVANNFSNHHRPPASPPARPLAHSTPAGPCPKSPAVSAYQLV